MKIYLLNGVENIVAKGDFVQHEPFLLLPLFKNLPLQRGQKVKERVR